MATRRRTDGFSEDGLSYSVASDFDKQIGQALAEMEARTDDPRFIPGARVESPDSPDILQRELMDPVLSAFGMPLPRSRDNLTRAIVPRLFETGGSIVQVDPLSGRSNIVHRGETKPDNRLGNFRLANLRNEASQLNSLRNDRLKMATSGTTPEAIATRLQEIDAEAAEIAGGQGRSQSQPAQPTVTAPPDLLSSSGFIGTPGGENLFEGPQRATGPVRPGQRGKLTRELAAKFREQARGDVNEARRLAREAGYEF
jgi:hypothetical protein